MVPLTCYWWRGHISHVTAYVQIVQLDNVVMAPQTPLWTLLYVVSTYGWQIWPFALDWDFSNLLWLHVHQRLSRLPSLWWKAAEGKVTEKHNTIYQSYFMSWKFTETFTGICSSYHFLILKIYWFHSVQRQEVYFTFKYWGREIHYIGQWTRLHCLR